MEWHIQYRDKAVEHVDRYPSSQRAIDAACRLIDAGCDVHGIGSGTLADSAGEETIAQLYQMWMRKKRPFGQDTFFIAKESRPQIQ